MITSAQSRAARGLLNWTQEELAKNAGVARATVVDFESHLRTPVRNNLLALEESMFAAGVDFLPDGLEEGVGVRFRERKLQYNKNVRIDRFNRTATIPMTFDDRRFGCIVPLDVLDDFKRGNLKTDDEFVAAFSEMLHHVLAAAERRAKQGFDGESMMLRHDAFPAGLL